MSLSRFTPKALRNLEHAFNRNMPSLFDTDRFFNDTFNMLAQINRPHVNVIEQSDKYLVEADMPGVKKENIELQVSDSNTLTLKGTIQPKEQKEGETADKNLMVWNQERIVGSFQRSFTFPTSIDKDQIHATLKEGVLSVEIPKHEAKINRIEIGE